MVRTRNITRRSKAAAEKSANTSDGVPDAAENEPMPIIITRENIVEEVTRAIQEAMPAILEQINENTRKMIEDAMLVEKEKKPINEIGHASKMAEDDQTVVEKEDFSECMPEFNGVCDPLAVMRWIFEMENIFKAIKCAEENKVRYAVSKLRSEALVWLDKVKDTSGLEKEAKITWSQFKRVLKGKFCPISVVMQLEEEFLTFKQGNQTVQEYTDRFVEMARFAEHQVATEERKIERYVRGLKTYIRELVSGRNLTTFQEAFEAAKEIEMDSKRKLEEKSNLMKRKREGSESRTCTKCQKSHSGECRYGSKGCYKCGKLGHLSRECSLTERKL